MSVAGGPGGWVAIVGAGPGDPELITRRGWRLLRHADLVLVDHLVSPAVLAELPPGVEVVDVGKRPHTRSVAQEVINERMVASAAAGRRVVRLKGGDPFVFGRGGEEAAACAAAGVDWEVVPGVSSAVAVPAAAGIPVTHRGVSQQFTVVSGHVAPGDPASTVDWAGLARGGGTIVVLMGVTHLHLIAAELVRAGRPPTTPVGVIMSGTTPDETVLTSTLAAVGADAAAGDVRPPAVVVVGEVVRLRDALYAAQAATRHAALPV
ncbi:MAG TPA: uroporphyrinogen-III C-methyltransferase [Mycobacteriales bacterium]|nr:uroporphyrinogen-III C-methyltransferase [Mycobacteriales bacterium]